jgi:type I restriction enzyme S subunit
MTDVNKLITDNIDVWTSAIKKRNSQGRGVSTKTELSGIKKLRELILDLAVRGKLVPQLADDESASVLLERITAEKGQLIADKQLKKQKALPAITNDEKPFELPNGWKFERLGNCSIVFSGSSFKSSDFNSDRGVRVIKITNAGVGKLIETNEYLPTPFLEKFESFQVFKNDLILALTRPYIHDGLKVSLCPDSYHKSLLNQRVAAIRAFEYPEYLFLNLRSPYILNLYKNRFGGNGLQPNLKMSDVTELVIAIPPLAEQQRIVAKVDELMALCDQLEQQTEESLSAHQTLVEVLLAALTNSDSANDFQTSWQRIAEHFDVLFTTEHSIEQLKQTILQLAVMGKLVPQNPSDEPASILLEKITEEKAQLIADKKIKKQKPLPSITDEEKPFELPSEWEWVRLGDVYRFLNGFAFKSEWFQEKGIKLLRNINIAHGETKWRETACIAKTMADEYSRFELEAGDIVISLDRPIINTGLKYAVIQTTDLPCLLLQRVAKFHSLADIVTPDFLSRWLESDLFINSIDPGRSNGVPHISTKQLEMMAFPLCSSNEQDRIVAKVDELMVLCEQLKARLSDAQTTQLHLVDAVVEQAIN